MSESRMTIGSGPHCDVQVLGDDLVSGFHARLTRDADGQFFIEDLGALNGTWLQRAGRPDPSHPSRLPRVWTPTPVYAGDTIWLSRMTAIRWSDQKPELFQLGKDGGR